MKVVLPEHVRPHLEGKLPGQVTPVWYSGGVTGYGPAEAAFSGEGSGAEVAWLDLLGSPKIATVVEAARNVKWISTSLAGVNGWPLQQIRDRGLRLTNGAGLNAKPVAEFAVMGVLAMAKNFRELVYAQDRKDYVAQAPGVVELADTRALIIGYGGIGRQIAQRLRAFEVEVVGVRRTPSGEPGVIGPDDWRGRLGEFDWIILAAAATRETARIIGPDELKAMKPSAVIVNIARGDLIDQAALIDAVSRKTIAGAFLDVTSPEPAPSDDTIWTTPNIVLTSHTSGRSQTRLMQRASALFLENLEHYLAGQPLKNQVDLELGY